MLLLFLIVLDSSTTETAYKARPYRLGDIIWRRSGLHSPQTTKNVFPGTLAAEYASKYEKLDKFEQPPAGNMNESSEKVMKVLLPIIASRITTLRMDERPFCGVAIVHLRMNDILPRTTEAMEKLFYTGIGARRDSHGRIYATTKPYLDKVLPVLNTLNVSSVLLIGHDEGAASGEVQ